MPWIIAGASIGSALIGGSSQRKAAREAARANLEQQRRALAFQREMTGKAVDALKAGKQNTFLLGQRMAKQGGAAVEQRMMSRGMNPGSSMYMRAQRAMYGDVNQYMGQLESEYARSIAAAYTQQEYPMVMQQGPQGNWAADYGMLGMELGKAISSSMNSSNNSGG